jgi:acyl-CoA synthetase (AMP-forming)/AMP-acid ligase II
LKDDRYGEVVAAFVRTPERGEELEEELRTWVRQRLSNHLGASLHPDHPASLTARIVPKYVFLGSDDFPKTASGKIQKFKLREMGEAMLKGAAQ